MSEYAYREITFTDGSEFDEAFEWLTQHTLYFEEVRWTSGVDGWTTYKYIVAPGDETPPPEKAVRNEVKHDDLAGDH